MAEGLSPQVEDLAAPQAPPAEQQDLDGSNPSDQTAAEVADAPAAETGTEAAAGEPVHITIKHEDDESADGPWDEDKAHTMANVLKEDKSLDRDLEGRKNTIDFLGSEKYMGRATSTERRDLEEAERGLELDRRTNSPDSIKQGEEEVSEARAKYDGAVKDVEAVRRNHPRESLEGINRSVEGTLEPFVELYDLNPDLFSEMPAKEFVEIATEFTKIKDRMTYDSMYLEDATNDTTRFTKQLEEMRRINWREVDSFTNRLTHALELDVDTAENIRKEFVAIDDDSFDKTPRQIVQGVADLAQTYVDKIKEHNDARAQQLQAILDKYRPHEEQTA